MEGIKRVMRMMMTTMTMKMKLRNKGICKIKNRFSMRKFQNKIIIITTITIISRELI